jgi:hypothetical protein
VRVHNMRTASLKTRPVCEKTKPRPTKQQIDERTNRYTHLIVGIRGALDLLSGPLFGWIGVNANVAGKFVAPGEPLLASLVSACMWLFTSVGANVTGLVRSIQIKNQEMDETEY